MGIYRSPVRPSTCPCILLSKCAPNRSPTWLSCQLPDLEALSSRCSTISSQHLWHSSDLGGRRFCRGLTQRLLGQMLTHRHPSPTRRLLPATALMFGSLPSGKPAAVACLPGPPLGALASLQVACGPEGCHIPPLFGQLLDLASHLQALRHPAVGHKPKSNEPQEHELHKRSCLEAKCWCARTATQGKAAG